MWAERSGPPTDLSRYQTRVWTESSQSWKTPTYYLAGRMRAKHKHADNHTALAQSCSFITSSLMECEIHSGWSSEDGIFDKEPTPPSSKSSEFQSLLHLLASPSNIYQRAGRAVSDIKNKSDVCTEKNTFTDAL